MKRPQTLESAKQTVESLLGKEVSVRLNRGRNKVHNYKGMLTEVYSNVFVVNLFDAVIDRISCSYADVVCGEIVLKETALK
ncbi:MAG: Veg family protein [Corallococcus sp.]|nr:Veg family protein [Corallococcus sp.]